MKTKIHFVRVLAVASLLACVATSSSCMTTYDANGRPVQSVDPALAVAGVAAAGLIGYAAGNDHDHHHHDGYYNRRYYGGGGGYYRGGYQRGYSR